AAVWCPCGPAARSLETLRRERCLVACLLLHPTSRPVQGAALAAAASGRDKTNCAVAAPKASPCTPLIRVLYTEPHGSVFLGRFRCLVRRALGRHPARRTGAARAC